jgi:TusA-related sulfurtransferase
MGLRHLDLATAEEGCGDNALGRVRRAYETLPPDEFLEVLTTVPEQAFAVRVWTRRAGGAVVEESREQGRIRIVLRRLDS